MKNEIIKRETLHSLKTIFSDESMRSELEKSYVVNRTEFEEGTNNDLLMVEINFLIKNDLLKDKISRLIRSIAPICYKINGKVFLRGNDIPCSTSNISSLYELQDIKTEISEGNSDSLYVSDLSSFSFASTREMVEVKKIIYK
jgi:hypothetical protein